MNEELKQKAEEWVKHNTDESIHSFDGEQLQKAYIAGATEATKELQEEVKYHKFQRCRECEGLHKENGNCTIVGGFYSAVSDTLCPKIKEKLELAKENKELQEENNELKNKIYLSVDCDKAEKHGDLCLGYGGDEDEPCEQCKNCIKCETGYYQLGETEMGCETCTKFDEVKLTEAKEIIRDLLSDIPNRMWYTDKTIQKAEAFLKE